jgi:hypothetical protein
LNYEKSRKFTAFIFENEVYQYTRIPFGLKNSLSGFIRALNSTLGTDSVGYAIAYIDDLVLFSANFQHLYHLDTVIGKLTAAGFNINASKCSFCRTEITFLGNAISSKGVTPDPKRIEAIQHFLTPKNVRQLRRFLGVCNYHHRFIVNYADAVATLLTLLKKGQKWKWTADLVSI